MNSSLRSVRKAIQQHIKDRSGPARRYPRAVRQAAVALAHRARREGVAWRRTARQLGLQPATLERWVSRRAGRLVPVTLSPAPAATPGPPDSRVVLVTPQGYRVEGLDAGELALLLRALS